MRKKTSCERPSPNGKARPSAADDPAAAPRCKRVNGANPLRRTRLGGILRRSGLHLLLRKVRSLILSGIAIENSNVSIEVDIGCHQPDGGVRQTGRTDAIYSSRLRRSRCRVQGLNELLQEQACHRLPVDRACDLLVESKGPRGIVIGKNYDRYILRLVCIEYNGYVLRDAALIPL
jgi:hypothetical protein